MVKCQTDWNSYYESEESDNSDESDELDFEELEEAALSWPAMEVFALKFNFGKRKQGYISGKIEIKDEYPGWHTLFSTPTDNDFLLVNTGKFTQLRLSGNKGLPISAATPVKMKLDLVDKSSGILDFGWNYGISVVEIKEGGEEEEDEEEEERKEDDDIKMTASELARGHQICRIWDDCTGFSNGFSRGHTEKLLRKKVTCPCFSLEVMYAVYKEAIAASVYVTFVKWNPSYFTGSSSMSNGMHVYGQVTARNTSLSHPDATTTLFGKEINDLFHVKLGDLIPFLKTYVVLPRKSSLILDIDLTHVLPNSGDHNLPPSELFVKTTLQITNQNSNNRIVVKDSGPAQLFVDVTWHRLLEMFYS